VSQVARDGGRQVAARPRRQHARHDGDRVDVAVGAAGTAHAPAIT
jgi:hypothetical protein